jgi:hypothetical protein
VGLLDAKLVFGLWLAPLCIGQGCSIFSSKRAQMFFSRKALESTRDMEVFKGLCCILSCMLKDNLRTAWVFLGELLATWPVECRVLYLQKLGDVVNLVMYNYPT